MGGGATGKPKTRKWGSDALLGSNVVEHMVDRHAFRQTCSKGRDLGVNVSKPCGAGPATHFLDEIFSHVVESQGHSSTGTEGMRTDTGRAITTGEEAREDDTLADCEGDVTGCDVGAQADETHREMGSRGIE
jgi:hypothetical protein